jgi:hypothetical protein
VVVVAVERGQKMAQMVVLVVVLLGGLLLEQPVLVFPGRAIMAQ